jgi:hypothetical protein
MSDPKAQKSRLPKSYTDEQLAFLRGHLAEFERRAGGVVRGEAKKFALARAEDFIVRFGLPADLESVAEAKPRFREVCWGSGGGGFYCWLTFDYHSRAANI